MTLPTQNYVKKYTQKEWDRFDINMQQRLTNRYTVEITDYETKQDKWKRRARSFNQENIDKGMSKFQNVMKKFDTGMEKALGKNKTDSSSMIFGNKKSRSIF